MNWTASAPRELRPDPTKILGQATSDRPRTPSRKGVLWFPDGITIAVSRSNTAHAVDDDTRSAWALSAISAGNRIVPVTLCGQMLFHDVVFDVWPRTNPWRAWPCQTCANTLKRARGGLDVTPCQEDGTS